MIGFIPGKEVRVTPTLPSNPSLVQLKKRAKELLRAQKAGEPSCCEVLRCHERFAGMSEDDVLAAEVTLAEVQHATARYYGHENWRALKTHVEGQGADDAIQQLPV